MENLYQPEWSMSQILGALWRHKFKAAFVFVLGCAATAVYFATARRMYESEAKLYVRVGRESVALDPTATTGQVVSLQDSREGEIIAIEQLLLSRELAEQVVDKLTPDVIFGRKPGASTLWSPKQAIKDALTRLEPYNLNPLKVYDVRDRAIAQVQNNLHVTAVRKTSVVTIAYSADDPALARDVVEGFVAAAQVNHLRIHRTKGSHEFFEKKEAQLRSELATQEAALRDLKDQTGFAELNTQRELLLKRIAGILDDQLATQADLSSAAAEVKARQEELARIPELVTAEQTVGQPNTPEQQMRTKLYDLEVVERGLATVQTDQSPQLIAVREQIKQARAILGDEAPKTQTTKSLNKVRQESELALSARQAQLVALKAKDAALTTQLADARSELKAINQSEIEMAQLQRGIDLAASNHGKYSEYLEQARIDNELQSANVSSLNPLQRPTYSITPVSPKPIQTLAGGFALACFASCGVVLLAERSRLAKLARRQPALSEAGRIEVTRPATIATNPPQANPVDEEIPKESLIPRPRRSEVAPSLPR
jgi:uncharacterized protein involved in exopolysaccharide biosynthesis